MQDGVYTATHGVGICFTNCANGEVIDAHEGFIDSPDAFDAWRLSSYFRSKKLLPDNRNDWKEVLLSLLEKGLIRPWPNATTPICRGHAYKWNRWSSATHHIERVTMFGMGSLRSVSAMHFPFGSIPFEIRREANCCACPLYLSI